jgi:hypothetical protein
VIVSVVRLPSPSLSGPSLSAEIKLAAFALRLTTVTGAGTVEAGGSSIDSSLEGSVGGRGGGRGFKSGRGMGVGPGRDEVADNGEAALCERAEEGEGKGSEQ